MEIKEIVYENFGNCVQITNGIISVAVSIDYGPRIVSFGFYGCDNLFYCDPEHRLSIGLKDSKSGGNNSMFYYYGGHRLWLTPEKQYKDFYADNSPVVYSILPDGVAFQTFKQKYSEIQTGFEVIMGEDAADIMVVHTAKNCSKEPCTCGLWPITMLKNDGLIVIPQNTDSTDPYRPNRNFVLWPGADIRDSRVFYGNRYLSVQCRSEDGRSFKIGTNNVLGWISYIGKSYTFMKRFVHSTQAVYPHFGCSCEVSIHPDFVELESLSPIYHIEPGEGIRHVENLSIFHTKNSVNPVDEDGIARYIENLK